MRKKYEVRSGNWKTIIETENIEDLKPILRTKIIILPDNIQLGFFIFVKEARNRYATRQIYCATSEVLAY